MAQFPVSFEGSASVFQASIQTTGGSFPADMGTVIEILPDVYQGEYEITPSAEAQIIPAGGMNLARDITVNPIPQNYGLITWNGSYLTVS